MLNTCTVTYWNPGPRIPHLGIHHHLTPWGISSLPITLSSDTWLVYKTKDRGRQFPFICIIHALLFPLETHQELIWCSRYCPVCPKLKVENKHMLLLSCVRKQQCLFLTNTGSKIYTDDRGAKEYNSYVYRACLESSKIPLQPPWGNWPIGCHSYHQTG